MILPLLFTAGCQAKTSSPSLASVNSAASETVPSSESSVVWLEKLTDNGVTLLAPSDQVSVYDADHTNGAVYVIKVAFQWTATSALSKADIVSSDQTILPDSAITFTPHTNFNSGLIDSGIIQITLQGLTKTGDVYLKASFVSSNYAGEKATLVKKLTFVPFGEIDAEAYTETLVLNWKQVPLSSPEAVTFQFEDENYIYGLKNPDLAGTADLYRDFWKIDLTGETGTEKSISFQYLVGHSYGLIFNVKTSKGTYLNYEISDAVGEGSTKTGFNQYKNGLLSFVKENSTLSLTVTSESYQ